MRLWQRRTPPGFHPRLLVLPRGRAVSTVLPPGADPRPEPGRGAEWYALGGGWYAAASTFYGSPEDPGLVGFAWARWPGVADLVQHHLLPLDTPGPAAVDPDPALLGFAP